MYILYIFYVYSESVFNTLYIQKLNIKKIALGKINGTKNALFFLRELQLITVLL